jgi:hypothetical protein
MAAVMISGVNLGGMASPKKEQFTADSILVLTWMTRLDKNLTFGPMTLFQCDGLCR